MILEHVKNSCCEKNLKVLVLQALRENILRVVYQVAEGKFESAIVTLKPELIDYIDIDLEANQNYFQAYDVDKEDWFCTEMKSVVRLDII